MPEKLDRFDWIVRLARVWLIASLGILVVTLTVTVAWTIVSVASTGQWTEVLPYIPAALAVLLGGVWVFIVYGLIQVVTANQQANSRSAGMIDRLETLLSEQVNTTRKLLETAALSDKAKSLLCRDREIEAFRETIREHLMRQDYAAAIALIDQIEKNLGDKEEATRLRREVEQSRQATIEEKIEGALNRVDALIAAGEWATAIRESQRLMQMFPDLPRVAGLARQIETAKAARKRELLETYDQAVKKNDIEASIALLKELDKYLTPQEAAALQESARGVFRAKLHNLGVQFSIKVAEEQWSEALSTGEQIIQEYPNTRMANEVREKMEMLRTKATQVGEGKVS